MNIQDINIYKFIQEYKPIPLEKVCAKFNLTSSALRKIINGINEYLPDDKKIRTKDQVIVTTSDYNTCIEFLKVITLRRYITSPEERIKFLLINFFINPVLTRSVLYEDLNVSSTTIKNDSQKLSEYLKDWGLKTEVIHKTGTRITGNETLFRIATSQLIFETVEIDHLNHIVLRLSNNPVEREIATLYLAHCATEINMAFSLLDQTGLNTLDYNSKKIFIVLASLFLYRNSLNIFCAADDITIPVAGYPYNIFLSEHDNHVFNVLIPALSSKENNFSIVDTRLLSTSRTLLASIAEKWQWRGYFYSDELLGEVYHCLHTALVYIKLKINQQDKKVTNIRAECPSLYVLLSTELHDFEQQYDLLLPEFFIAALCVIFKKHELRQALLIKQKTRVVIVSNSSDMMISFFKEKLTSYFAVDLVDTININESGKLRELSFDKAIVFTNKISSYINDYHIDYIKVSFNMSAEDIKILLDAGLSLNGSLPRSEPS